MNISATNNINFSAKLRKIHKTGEYTGRLPDNPYMGKIKKLNNDLENISKKINMAYSDRLNGILEEQDFKLFSVGLINEK